MTAEVADPDLAFARALAEQVIRRLGPEAPPLRIERIEYHHGFDEARFEAVLSNEPSDEVMITVRVDDPAAYPIGAYVSLFAPRQDAIAMTATGIQDYALEYTYGDLLPPCPAHQHPSHPAVVDGVASCVCPHDPDHHREPIMPTPTEA